MVLSTFIQHMYSERICDEFVICDDIVRYPSQTMLNTFYFFSIEIHVINEQSGFFCGKRFCKITDI